MLKFYRILLLTLVAVFLASAAGIARYAADSCTQARMYRQLAAQTEEFPDDADSDVMKSHDPRGDGFGRAAAQRARRCARKAVCRDPAAAMPAILAGGGPPAAK